jgi:hypothetical protein
VSISKVTKTATEPHAAELRTIADRVGQRLRRSALDVVVIGQDLLRAKELLGHGRFGPWIEQEFGLSHRTATQFMRAADRFAGRLEAASVLPGGVLLELASPSVPDELVDRVFAREVPPTVAAVRAEARSQRSEAAALRASLRFVDELWSLPDESARAADVLARAVADEQGCVSKPEIIPGQRHTRKASCQPRVHRVQPKSSG